ncbi:hypothetical protein JTB14_028962 [Gonioctena quinquepunctata]|nr:hypothetical protein JTB14_028962 [Gonioctena quinquepunctata]
MLTFEVGNEVIDEFEEPFSISFENAEKNYSWIPSYETATPSRPNDTAIDGSDFEKMDIFRIDVFGQQGYVVEFLNLADNYVLDVYITDFVKPSPIEFKDESTQIHANNTLISMSNEDDFNSWHYLCIMPNEKMDDQRVAVKFRIYAMSCFSWQSENRTWAFSCGAAATSTLIQIDCICYHSSVLVGKITPNFVREESTDIFSDHELELETDLIIFVSLAVAFFLYCVILAIICVLSDWDYERRIYLLRDMPGSSLNGYILIVRTAYGFNAGTTSHVVIRIHGKEAATEVTNISINS